MSRSWAGAGMTEEITAFANAMIFDGVFAGKEPLGYVSDHIGLRARLSLAAGTAGAAPGL